MIIFVKIVWEALSEQACNLPLLPTIFDCKQLL